MAVLLTAALSLTMLLCYFLQSAFFSRLRCKLSFITVINQRIHISVCNKNNVAASSAISAVRSTVRYIFLTPEAYMTIAAFSGFNCYLRVIY